MVIGLSATSEREAESKSPQVSLQSEVWWFICISYLERKMFRSIVIKYKLYMILRGHRMQKTCIVFKDLRSIALDLMQTLPAEPGHYTGFFGVVAATNLTMDIVDHDSIQEQGHCWVSSAAQEWSFQCWWNCTCSTRWTDNQGVSSYHPKPPVVTSQKGTMVTISDHMSSIIPSEFKATSFRDP